MSRARSVLVVDDDAEGRSLLREVLEAEGCSVYVAENGRAALDMLRVVRPDLLVVDLMMPVMNGWELCEALDRDAALVDIPLVILSGAARFGPRNRTRVLAKPLRLNALIGLLDIVDAP